LARSARKKNSVARPGSAGNANGGFFYPKVLQFLVGEGLAFGIKVPLWKWLGIRERITARRRWARVDDSVSGFETTLAIPQWDLRLRVVVYRKRVFHETAKNFQLNLFSPDDGHYEYSAVATSLPLGVRALWHFMAGRGGHEKTLAELKQHLAFGAIPTNQWLANSVWQHVCVLTHKLVRSFQLHTGAAHRPRTWKRTCGWVFGSLLTCASSCSTSPRASSGPRVASSSASPWLPPRSDASSTRSNASTASPLDRRPRPEDPSPTRDLLSDQG
jgi:hypothetical protein